MKKRRIFFCGIVTLLFVLAAVILSLCWGSYKLLPQEVWSVLSGGGEKLARTAVMDIRLPRILTGALVAAALAVSGAILQTMTKNELADPGILGINAGGAVAAVLFIQMKTTAYYSELGENSIYVLPFMAITGAFLTALFIYFFSSHDGLRPKRLLLVGIGVNAGLNAFITAFTFRSGVGDYNRILIWTTGSLWGAGWQYVKVLFPVVISVMFYILWKSKIMDAMSFSDETAIGWGVEVERERKKLLLASIVLAGAATAFAGNIGFLGLISPHIARKLVGTKHSCYLPVSAGISIAILLTADAVSRNLFSPVEIPAGILVSIVGVPYFAYLMIRES